MDQVGPFYVLSAFALKADIPEHLRPSEGFLREFKRGLGGK